MVYISVFAIWCCLLLLALYVNRRWTAKRMTVIRGFVLEINGALSTHSDGSVEFVPNSCAAIARIIELKDNTVGEDLNITYCPARLTVTRIDVKRGEVQHVY